MTCWCRSWCAARGVAYLRHERWQVSRGWCYSTCGEELDPQPHGQPVA